MSIEEIENIENKTVSIDITKDDSLLNDNHANSNSNNSINSKIDEHKKENHIEDNVENIEEDDIINFTVIKEKIKDSFSKLKQNLKSDVKNKDKHKSPSKVSNTNDDELEYSLSSIIPFFKKNKKWIIPLCLIFIAILFSTYFRMMPDNLPITDTWAENTVHSFYLNQITNQINQQYPNLPEQNKNSLINKEFENFLKENKGMYNQQIVTTSQQYKNQMQDENGQTYLLAIDPYYWYNLAKWRIESGHWGNTLNENQEDWSYNYDGREGRPMHFEFHSFIIFILYSFLSIFSSISILKTSFYLPVILIGISIIPAFFIGKRISGNVGGFFASMIVAINSALLSRTPAGFSDTDSYQIFFPLFIVWLIFEAFEVEKIQNKILLPSLSGLMMGIYLLAWQGGTFILNIILAGIFIASLIKLIHTKIKTKKLNFLVIKNELIIGGSFFIVSAISLYLFNKKNIFQSIWEVITATKLKEVAVAKIWPNVLTTVAEFNTVPLKEIINQMGGNLFFLIAIIGIIILFIKKKGNIKSSNDPLLWILIVWLIVTTYGFTKGIRFAILMVPAFAIAFGTTLGITYQYSNKWITEHIKINKNISKIIIIILFCLLFISPIINANNIAKNEIPSMNDAWYNSLTKIKDATTDAIITSWWDFGHWFIAIGERRVTFDGAAQRESIHWVGKTLLTSDEQISVGLLRMLNCGHEKPVHILEEFFNGDTIKSVDVLNEMLVLNNKNDAIKLLKIEGLTNEQVAEIIGITYCDELIDHYYITSEDMVGKAGVWGHFGSWDFERASMYQEVSKNKAEGRNTLSSKFNLSEEIVDEYYSQIINTPADQWVSPWPGYQGNTNCNKIGNNLECNLNLGQGSTRLIIDLNSMNASIPSDDGNYYPNSFVYATKEGITEKVYGENLIGLSVILLPESNQIILAHSLQANSMFTQLFFFNGHGLKCFEKFNDVTSFNGQRIITWKVDFTCQQENKIYFVPEKEVNAAHILISTQDRNEEEALKLINSIQENLTADNFAEYAKEYSEDHGSATNGGDLGWFSKGQMVPEFEEVVFSLEKNKISNPVNTQFGYHLILLKDKRTK
jgi:dolichyl-phosphooligosaccharide-protein glycotransferase